MTPEILRAVVVQWWNAGWSTALISRMLWEERAVVRSPQQISALMRTARRQGVALRRHGVKSQITALRLEVVRRWNAGATGPEIARDIGCPPEYIQGQIRAARMAGLEVAEHVRVAQPRPLQRLKPPRLTPVPAVWRARCEAIIREECAARQVCRRALLEGRNFAPVVAARRAILRRIGADLPQMSMTRIGAVMNLHHSTVLYALGRLKSRGPERLAA